MYHKVQAIPPAPGYLGNYVLPEQFEEQVSALLRWGYTPVTIERWLQIRAGRFAPPERPIALTFDDGYLSVYENAWPVLRRKGVTATIFLVANCIGGTNRWDKDEPQQPLMGPAEIAELQAAGVLFGSHTCTHRALTELSSADALEELTRSRAALEELLARPIMTLAYPYNRQNREVRALARKSGYLAAVVGRGRLNARRTNPYTLMRIAIKGETTMEEFERRLARPRWVTGL